MIQGRNVIPVSSNLPLKKPELKRQTPVSDANDGAEPYASQMLRSRQKGEYACLVKSTTGQTGNSNVFDSVQSDIVKQYREQSDKWRKESIELRNKLLENNNTQDKLIQDINSVKVNYQAIIATMEATIQQHVKEKEQLRSELDIKKRINSITRLEKQIKSNEKEKKYQAMSKGGSSVREDNLAVKDALVDAKEIKRRAKRVVKALPPKHKHKEKQPKKKVRSRIPQRSSLKQ